MPQVIQKVKAKPYVYAKHFGPHDIYDGEIGTGVRRIDTAKTLGIIFEGNPDVHGIPDVSVESGIDKARTMWPRLYIDEKNCPKAISALSAYQYVWDEKRGMWSKTPYHNWASHFGDIVRYASLVENKMVIMKPIIRRNMSPKKPNQAV